MGIDWGRIKSGVNTEGSNVDASILRQSYHVYIAPIVALWLLEDRLASKCADVNRDFGDHKAYTASPPW